MDYIEEARKKFPKEKVEFMIGGAVDALKKFSSLNVPGIPAIGDLTEKINELQNIASSLQSGATEQLKNAVENSGLATNISKIVEGGQMAQNLAGSIGNLDDSIKNKLDEASNLASALSSPQKLQNLANQAQELLGALDAVGILKQAAQKFLGGQSFIEPLMKPLVGKMVDTQKVWELPSQYKAEYPHNKVTSTPSGHTIQLDDTPGEERIMVADMRGNYVEMGKDGVNIRSNTKMNITVGSASPGGEFSLRIKSKCDIHVDGDANIKVSGNMDGEVEGDSSMLVKGKAGIVVNGNASTLVKGNAGIHVDRNASIHSNGPMKVRTETAMTLESGTTMDINAGGAMNITAKGPMVLKAPTIDLNP